MLRKVFGLTNNYELAKDSFEKALSTKQSGELQSAIELYKHAIWWLDQIDEEFLEKIDDVTQESVDELMSSVYSAMANTYLSLDNPSEALRLCDQALKLNANNGIAWTNKAVACWHLGKPEYCRMYHEKALQVDDTIWESWNGLGNLMVDHFQEYDLAIEYCQRALELCNGNTWMIWHNLGNAHLFKNLTSAAITAYDHAYQNGGIIALCALFNKVVAAINEGDVSLAKNTLVEMIRCSPDSPYTLEAQEIIERD